MFSGKTFTIGLYVLFIILFFLIPVSALEDQFVPYTSYTYNFWANPVAAPVPYIPGSIINSRELGLDLKSPQDIFVGDNNQVYLLDTGNNRLIILNNKFEVESIINEFINRDSVDHFNEPQGLFVTNKEIYIADTGNRRIVVLNHKGELLKEVGPPSTGIEGLIPDDYNYRPAKIAVDIAGRIYVISSSTYEGLLEFDVDGNFGGFIGAPRVRPNMIDYFWKRFIASEAQRDKMALALPTEYSNLDIDNRGFIYTTVSRGQIRQSESIRRLNPAGKDVLRRTGFRPPIGDYGSALRDTDGNLILPPSMFMDIAVGEFGIYNALDVERGRVFTYDMYGQLLYVFGSRSLQKGGFKNPVALDTLSDNRILVLDADLQRITVFRPTEYQQVIYGALRNYHTGKYDLSTKYWEKVLTLNRNYDLAYTGLGEAYLRQNRYLEAMHNYRLGQNRKGYAEAFRLHRMEVIEANFGLIVVILIILIIVSVIIVKGKRIIGSVIKEVAVGSEGFQKIRKNSSVKSVGEVLKSLHYGLHVIFHPFDGFWDLKHEKKGNLPAALVILALVCITYIIMAQYTGFVFSTLDITKFNIMMEIASIIFPFLLWCMINWALTTLMEGKGTFKDIFIASAFALLPLILINIPATFLSNFLTLEEGPFYYSFMLIAILWSGGLIFFGTMVTHAYDFTKTLITTILIIGGIIFTLFLSLLFFNLTSQVIQFLKNIYVELLYRL